MLIQQCCIYESAIGVEFQQQNSYPQEERRSIFPPALIREFTNKGPYKTFRCNEIGDCVRCTEWINRNRLLDTSRMKGRYARSDDGWIRLVLLNAFSPRLIVLAKLLCYKLRWAMTSDLNGEIWISTICIADGLSSKLEIYMCARMA